MSNDDGFCLAKLNVPKIDLPFELPKPPQEPLEVTRVVTHDRWDADNATALWVGFQFGDKALPGFSEAPVCHYSQEHQGRSWQDWLQEGVLLIDCGGEEGNPFDHQPHGVARYCATDRMVEFCGLKELSELREIMNDVRAGDLMGARTAGAQAAHVLWTMKHPAQFAGKGPTSRQILRRFMRDYLGRLFVSELDFFHRAGPEFERNAETRRPFGNDFLKVALIQTSGRHKVAGYGFSGYSTQGSHHIVIQWQESGHFQILALQREEIDLQRVAGVVRNWEMQERGIETEYDVDEICCPAYFDPCSYWYVAWSRHYDGAWGVFNGSRTHKHVKPTRLTAEEIYQAVLLGVEPIFHPDCPRTHCLYDGCSFWGFGWPHCQEVRKSQAKTSPS